MTSSCGRTCRTAPNSSSAPFSNTWYPTSMSGSLFFAMGRMMPWPRAGCIGPEWRNGPPDQNDGREKTFTPSRRALMVRRTAPQGATPAPEMKRMDQFKSKVAPADGKLAVLLPGMGAVATTFIAGVEAVKAGLGKPIGSLTQMAHVRLGKRSEKRWAMIKDLGPLARLQDLVFGGWDPIPDDAYTAAVKAKVLSPEHLAQLQPTLSKIRPMPAVFDKNVVKRLEGANVKRGTKREFANQLIQDIRGFMGKNKSTRAVMVWCASTEAYQEAGSEHQSIAAVEKAL